MTENLIHTDVDTIDYDYENDSLFLFLKGAEYSHSLNLDNIIIDFGEGNYIKGVEIQNASKKFGVSKYALKNPHEVDVELNVSDEKIELKIRLTLRIRNKYLPKVIATTDMNEFNIPSGTMAMSCGMC
ncbi:DUF2283 domain-containing protein [Methanogenium organophilum]|uniref:DUF2283 domain-containing protein n=1 Tax=Methanogenium organophilum TaxID=2199 RepID=A0A9X9T7H7_METOG|nr:DUF2283 domain-containing protein [Methanogenium organophilum]WAI01104.1 DUF2283 domain-containing protein [Methanogenium organophilum]